MTNAKMPAFWVAALYVTTAAAIYLSVRGVSATGGWLPLLVLIPLMALLLPPFRTKLDPRSRYLPGAPWTLGIAVALMFFQASLFGSHAATEAEQQATKRQQESAARIAKAQADHAGEYARDKPQILAQVEALLAANRPQDALAAANRYFTVTKDPDLARLQSRAATGVLKLELQNEAALSLARRKDIYTTLIQEEAGGLALYQTKLKAVTAKLEQETKVQARATERAALEASVKSQFSSWDGSHRAVEQAIKARMKNPASYTHVDTRYSVGTDSLSVVTSYRGTNGFGAIVTNQAVATVDRAGNVLALSDH
jgi:hypothetical protein